MSQLLVMSFDVMASPSIWLRRDRSTPEGRDGTGWGFAWYPEGNYSAAVVRDPRPVSETGLTRVLRDWDRFRSTIFLCHVRGAAKRPTERDTHPFARAYARRDFLFAHNGQLDSVGIRALSLGDVPVFEPVGTTDSEYAFCWILTRMRERGARSLGDVPFDVLHGWFRTLNEHGTLNVMMSDGLDVVVYSDRSGFRPLHFVRRLPPHETTRLSNGAVRLEHDDPMDVNRTMLIAATRPLSEGWSLVGDGEMLVTRLGDLRFWSAEATQLPAPADEPSRDPWRESAPEGEDGEAAPETLEPEQPPISERPGEYRGARRTKKAPLARCYRILHKTRYAYERPVERSTHVFRLRPELGPTQNVQEFELDISVPHDRSDFQDVFGNQASRVRIRDAYSELEVTARSVVEVRMPPPVEPRNEITIPLVWMPWQRQMMTPFLLPPELPETQLRELSAFGMSFAERQGFDVVQTLRDINSTIRRDFKYVQHVTSLATTPFEIYVNRRGVCQDFANLFICLARLLGVPARYRVGYIHTGADYENQLQSEASHAWVEVYLPWYGWRGFDPTNGCLANLDHVSIAAGRNFVDATPTSGTLFKGGGNEKMSVVVEVEQLD